MTTDKITPAYFNAPISGVWNDWTQELKEWVRKFFEACGPHPEAWDTPNTMNCPFLSFAGGVIVRQNKEDIGGDCGLVLMTLNPQSVLKYAKVATIDELISRVDPVEFANKVILAGSRHDDHPDYVDVGDIIVEFYVTRLLCEDTMWNIGLDMDDPKRTDPVYIFNSAVCPPPQKRQGSDLEGGWKEWERFASQKKPRKGAPRPKHNASELPL